MGIEDHNYHEQGSFALDGRYVDPASRRALNKLNATEFQSSIEIKERLTAPQRLAKMIHEIGKNSEKKSYNNLSSALNGLVKDIYSHEEFQTFLNQTDYNVKQVLNGERDKLKAPGSTQQPDIFLNTLAHYLFENGYVFELKPKSNMSQRVQVLLFPINTKTPQKAPASGLAVQGFPAPKRNAYTVYESYPKQLSGVKPTNLGLHIGEGILPENDNVSVVFPKNIESYIKNSGRVPENFEETLHQPVSEYISQNNNFQACYAFSITNEAWHQYWAESVAPTVPKAATRTQEGRKKLHCLNEAGSDFVGLRTVAKQHPNEFFRILNLADGEAKNKAKEAFNPYAMSAMIRAKVLNKMLFSVPDPKTGNITQQTIHNKNGDLALHKIATFVNHAQRFIKRYNKANPTAKRDTNAYVYATVLEPFITAYEAEYAKEYAAFVTQHSPHK